MMNLVKVILTRFRRMCRFLSDFWVVLMYNRDMKKKGVIANYIISGIICQVLCLCGVLIGGSVYAEEMQAEIAPEKLKTISEHCEAIRSSLKVVQKNDARARVYLGAYYETILSKYITPLNVKLVENNISNLDLIENQNKFVKTKTAFNNDFISYQKELEELVLADCKNEPAKFYEELVSVRKKQSLMIKDMAKLADLISEQKGLVKKLKGEL